MLAPKTFEVVNTAIEANQELEHRRHLGASVIGRDCSRQLWYGFRWTYKENFSAKQLRLFDRGNEFEPRAVEWLEKAGMIVWEKDPNTGKQFRISDCNGHFGGSLDGIVGDCPDLPPGSNCLVEFKTHGDASFKKLVKEGLTQAKPEHFAQCQIYMYKMGLDFALYLAVNKNTDEIHVEIIKLDLRFAKSLIEKANDIIEAVMPPEKIGGKSQGPGFYLCRFCSFSKICHKGIKPEKNCRTCKFSRPVEKGEWHCDKIDLEISDEIMPAGCQFYQTHEGFQ